MFYVNLFNMNDINIFGKVILIGKKKMIQYFACSRSRLKVRLFVIRSCLLNQSRRAYSGTAFYSLRKCKFRRLRGSASRGATKRSVLFSFRVHESATLINSPESDRRIINSKRRMIHSHQM